MVNDENLRRVQEAFPELDSANAAFLTDTMEGLMDRKNVSLDVAIAGVKGIQNEQKRST